MGDIDDMLGRMTSRELLELQARIHEAIRAHIRVKNAQMAAAAGPRPAGPTHLPQVEIRRQQSLAVHARIRHIAEPVPVVAKPAAITPTAASPPGSGEQPSLGDDAFDLARERDAWLARKRTSAR